MRDEPEPWEGNPGVSIEMSAETMLRPFGEGHTGRKGVAKGNVCPRPHQHLGKPCQSCEWPPAPLGLAHLFCVFPQLILLGLALASGCGGASGGDVLHRLHILHNLCNHFPSGEV